MESKQVTIPATAQWCPQQTLFNGAQAIADHKRDIANYNAQVQTAWDGSCALWKQQAEYNRTNHVEPNPPPKPVWTKPQYEVNVVFVQAWVMPTPGEPTITVTTPTTLDSAAGFYMYDTTLPAQICPDLPAPTAPPVAPPPTAIYPVGTWISPPPGDKWPVGHIEVHEGQVWKKGSVPNMFGGVTYYYERIG